MIERQDIERATTALTAQRLVLGEAVVETTLAALQAHLASLERPLALKGERKQVTVMFADISGFTAMSEKLDPEEVRSMINGCFERLGAVIDQYGGHIDKFIGDEIMALFGAPAAHENDPERALRAALDMMAALEAFNDEHINLLPKRLALHFGINTGLVIAGGIGTAQRQDYSVMGDAVNLAARLEDLSEAGEILVGEDTYRLTAPLFEFEAGQPVMVKGKEKPVQVHRLLRVKGGASQIRGIEGLTSPMVGREREFAQAKTILNHFQKGQGGVLSVIGDAGLGKTRLISELNDHCARTCPTHWAEGHALSYGENASYLVARDALRNLLGVGAEATPAEIAQALRAELERLFPGQASELYPFLAYLLDVPLYEETAQRLKYWEGELLHQRILQTVQQFLLTRSQEKPVVLVWDDLHWGDPSSLGLLESLLPLTQQCPLLLILVYRPVRESRVWSFHQRIDQRLGDTQQVIELAPLSLEESSQLLDNLLDYSELPPKIRQRILSKAEGNPFYIEEVLRSLIDSGALARSPSGLSWQIITRIDDVAIPDTLQGVIMARIDRLDHQAKRVLQVASVIGRNFSYKLLAQVLGTEHQSGELFDK
jgi:class 3 adenylate cyclase